MHDSSWVNEGDTCVENPINCEEGLSFSIWEKITYDSNVLVDRENAVQDRKYIVSSGGDYDPIAGTGMEYFIHESILTFCKFQNSKKRT